MYLIIEKLKYLFGSCDRDQKFDFKFQSYSNVQRDILHTKLIVVVVANIQTLFLRVNYYLEYLLTLNFVSYRSTIIIHADIYLYICAHARHFKRD